ncbi:hydroxyphenylacetyl-CoA thioesterase PaaI [Rhodococcus sp. BP-252]|uniref:hydroxyphenylacetyl-CoA thioesterase PaaI n=1 Tax=unclassified Rhodococcus (in: high G+C Gram-positive bacteria) TaxID=192944 RepID=UPI001C9ABA13|nr:MULTISPECIES: hydroxyphenylacetyl-CoA thioesterase PaaI [unclassified Rhodococcus (in: high G+C Gram-positive bacteria)]MBY6412828.1 hydroxyphenylacetyl-CoA thioesterase PaaI [Rhodococcus sp. BP-320]MBY6417635.1 hydroxyphenylacetyl-CoA thioesterase PaaI [Rhodococcus sp. BP-321]MBY6423487.1 hydroxyphenylacetyl-CoA thioesterase PaaI [Rhodococcus sp. BP-324]MBY6427659.1 hydroxyphenylacetyl-CoA thioesterase PaaI [Rhodococcus sp. BP-323]MBY6432823.1 hydroxyphenylacetyl-CoA thioesterase PaaI [Rho
MFAADAASRKLGIELLKLGPGTAKMAMAVTEDMVNGHGITHGGYVFLLADTTFAMACNSRDDAAVAARCDIRYLRPTRSGDVLVAHAVERAAFGRNGIYDVTVSSGDRVVAEFRGDSRRIPGWQNGEG